MNLKRATAPGYYWFLLIILIALVMRLLSLSTRPIWYDEAFSMLFSIQGLEKMIFGTLASSNGGATDIHPLFYYFLLWTWINIWGNSLEAARTLSVLFGTGTVVIAYLLSRELFPGWTSLLVAALVAGSPFQIHFSQEIRMYSLLAFLLILAAYFVWMGTHRKNWVWWFFFSITAALSQYTHSLAIIFLLPLALTPVFFRKWEKFKSVFLAGLGAMVLYLPWLFYLPGQFSKVQQGYWIDRPNVASVIKTLLSYTTNLPLPPNWLPAGLFITFLCCALALWQTGKAVWNKSSGVICGLWMAYLAFSPVLLLFLVSQFQPVYIERALLPSAVVFLAWLGWAFFNTGLPKVIQGVVYTLLIIGFGMGVYQHLTYRGFPYGPYQELDASFHKRLLPGDVILHSNKLTMFPAFFYDRNLPHKYISDPPGSGSDTLAITTQMVLGLSAQPSISAAVGDAKRIWLVIFQRAIEEYQVIGYKNHPHLIWMDSHMRLESVEIWGDIRVYLYTNE